MNRSVYLNIRRLTPALSKAISSSTSPPTFWTERTMPRPKALCPRRAPFRYSLTAPGPRVKELGRGAGRAGGFCGRLGT